MRGLLGAGIKPEFLTQTRQRASRQWWDTDTQKTGSQDMSFAQLKALVAQEEESENREAQRSTQGLEREFRGGLAR